MYPNPNLLVTPQLTFLQCVYTIYNDLQYMLMYLLIAAIDWHEQVKIMCWVACFLT